MNNVMIEEKVLKLDKSNWLKTKLGDLATEISKRVDNPSTSEYDRFVSLRSFVSGDIKIKSWEPTDNLASSARAFQAGDILFARRNAYLRRASLVDFDGCCSGDAFVLRENHDKVVPGFLAFLLNSDALWDYANSNAAGTMSKRVKWRDLAEYEFLLPPKDQQAKLAELLWAMDGVIERENEVLISIQSLLEAERRKMNTGNLKEISGEEITSLITKGASPKWQGFDYCDEGTLFVTSENVLEDAIDLKEKKFLPIAFHEKQKRSKLKKGDILINIVGASIGRLAIFDEDVKNANINQAVCLFRIKKDLVRPEYIVNYLLEESNKTRLLNNQSATARPNLSLTNLNEYKFFLPTLEEQDIRLIAVFAIKSTLDNTVLKINSSKALQKSLINQVF
jgi:type I restriction enzyme S subunit